MVERGQMFGWFKKHQARRRLAPVVGRLPYQLGQYYGFGRHYTVGQVRMAAKAVKLSRQMQAYAFAACCSADEFARMTPLPASDDYQRLRSELVALYEIPKPTFDCTDLLRLSTVPRSSQWHPQSDTGTGTPAND
jgi:hypothetical protein